MEQIEWSKDELGRKLAALYCEFFGVDRVTGETPMSEIRARLELVGTMLGRTIAVLNHDGPIGADIAMTIRALEQNYKGRCAATAGKLYGPGGQLREMLNPQPGTGPE